VAAGPALSPRRYVGQALTRREDERVLRGRARYVDDIELPGMAHIAFARSPHAYARVGAVRVPRTLPPGVFAVVTPDDLAGRVRRYPKAAIEGMEVSDDQHPVLPEGEVRYVGQPVAAVVAASRALAEDVSEEIEVEYASDPLDIGFNSRYLLDIAAQIEGEVAVLRLADPGSPTLMQDKDNKTALYVLMPMRV